VQRGHLLELGRLELHELPLWPDVEQRRVKLHGHYLFWRAIPVWVELLFLRGWLVLIWRRSFVLPFLSSGPLLGLRPDELYPVQPGLVPALLRIVELLQRAGRRLRERFRLDGVLVVRLGLVLVRLRVDELQLVPRGLPSEQQRRDGMQPLRGWHLLERHGLDELRLVRRRLAVQKRPHGLRRVQRRLLLEQRRLVRELRGGHLLAGRFGLVRAVRRRLLLERRLERLQQLPSQHLQRQRREQLHELQRGLLLGRRRERVHGLRAGHLPAGRRLQHLRRGLLRLGAGRLELRRVRRRNLVEWRRGLLLRLRRGHGAGAGRRRLRGLRLGHIRTCGGREHNHAALHLGLRHRK
jgi:hypothetical protein